MSVARMSMQRRTSHTRDLCSKRGCKREPTIAHDVRPSFMRVASAEYGLDQTRVPIRHYEVCEKHDTEYFGTSNWLTDTQARRIKKELTIYHRRDAKRA